MHVLSASLDQYCTRLTPAYIITQGLFCGLVCELPFVTNCTCECVFNFMAFFFRFVHHYYAFSLIYFRLFSISFRLLLLGGLVDSTSVIVLYCGVLGYGSFMEI